MRVTCSSSEHATFLTRRMVDYWLNSMPDSWVHSLNLAYSLDLVGVLSLIIFLELITLYNCSLLTFGRGAKLDYSWLGSSHSPTSLFVLLSLIHISILNIFVRWDYQACQKTKCRKRWSNNKELIGVIDVLMIIVTYYRERPIGQEGIFIIILFHDT